MDKPLHIAINAQLVPGGWSGGVEVALTELVAALGKLSQLDGGQEQYVIVGPSCEPDWLKPFTTCSQRVISGAKPPAAEKNQRLELLKRVLGPVRPVIRKLRRTRAASSQLTSVKDWLEVPASKGFFENLGCDVIHFPYQPYIRCALPTVYNPHDLQHLHYPQFFTAAEIARRESVYRAGCRHSDMVVVGSHWTKQDIVRHYEVSPDKVQVIPWAAPIQNSPEPSSAVLAAVREKYKLNEPFALYPAATWEHKNHLRLLEAVAYLRDHSGLEVRVICTGHQTRFYQRIADQLRALRLDGQAQFLGSIPVIELRALYRLAQFVVIPTLFEAASAPLFEAWRDSVPVACAAVTSLPEQAGDAALLFDPLSVEAIADALRQMRSDAGLRQDLIQRGVKRLGDFSWERTARAYRAIYRRAAGRRLSEAERRLLDWDWMREPHCKVKN